jgi:L-asparaginase II
MTGELAARVYRGRAVEAEHAAVVAVVDADGRLTHYLGDPEAVFMTRSSIKPFQALPLIVTGGFDRFGFGERHLAVMCASHNGDDIHRDTVLECLQKIGLGPESLQCGAHRPLGMEIRGEFPLLGEERDPLRSDCSGKHSGFLALAKSLGVPLEKYLDPETDSQQLVRRTVAECCEYDPDAMEIGVDGCTAPNFSMPVKNLAIGFKNLALARAESEATRMALRRVRDAMTAYPELVAGEGRFDYDFMRAFSGQAVCKLGAEAIEGTGFTDPPIGIAVKVLDGNRRALAPICLEVLRQLGLIEKAGDIPLLEPYFSPEVRNARQLVTGRIEVDFRLRKA